MSRYKKASHNECELKEIDGVKPVLRVSRDEKLEVIELFFDQQKNKGLDLKKARELISKLLYNSLFLWEKNERTNKKEEGEEDTTKEDIDDYVVNNMFELWLEILGALKIVDTEKLKELQEEQAKKLNEPQKENPN
jgi:hypothetical protein